MATRATFFLAVCLVSSSIGGFNKMMVAKNYSLSYALNYCYMKQDLLIPLGLCIANIRKAKKMSQDTLGKLCKIDKSLICSIENGRRNVAVVTLYKIAVSLGVDITELVSGCNK